VSGRFLIAGAGGMLGTALREALASSNAEVVAPGERDFDITDAAAVSRVVEAFASGGPGTLLNAAAYTNVERAEDEPELAFLVNEAAPRILAETAAAHGLRFAHVSTDFVFDGDKRAPYVETDATNPLSVYGASKLAGELAVLDAMPGALVVRTAWSYFERGVNFPLKVLALASTRDEISVVTDEVGSPTYAPDLARGIIGLAEAGAGGVFHLAGAGACSRFEMATELLALVGSATRVMPTTSDRFPSAARRPAYSVLDCGRAAALGVRMPAWTDALRRFAERLDAGATC
jgi:dTDP-4-dehydrorhamnose reductase